MDRLNAELVATEGASEGSGAAAQSRPARIKLSRNKARANLTPAASPDQLTTLWDRQFSVYRTFIVRVTARRGSKLSFMLFDTRRSVEVSNRGKPFLVDLDDGAMVWSDLPSTAPLVKPGSAKQYGFLLLSDEFLKVHADILEEIWKWLTGNGTGDGPKIPPLACL